MAKQLQTIVVTQKNVHPVGSLIFLHGAGGNGPLAQAGIKMSLGKELTFPHLRVLYPTAPKQAYTFYGGSVEHVWFNRLDCRPEAPEIRTSVEVAAEQLQKLIDEEASMNSLSHGQILIGGFSMGGGMALQMGYRFCPGLCGIFAMSSFLSLDSAVYQNLAERRHIQYPPLFMTHGEQDDLVLHSWGKNTFDLLQQLGVKGHFFSVPDERHHFQKKELDLLLDWINVILPNPV